MQLTMWDLEAGKKLEQVAAHAGDVCSMSLRAEDQIVVTGSVDRTTKVWDLRTFKCTQTFFGHQADVNSVHVTFTYFFRCFFILQFLCSFLSLSHLGITLCRRLKTKRLVYGICVQINKYLLRLFDITNYENCKFLGIRLQTTDS